MDKRGKARDVHKIETDKLLYLRLPPKINSITVRHLDFDDVTQCVFEAGRVFPLERNGSRGLGRHLWCAGIKVRPLKEKKNS